MKGLVLALCVIASLAVPMPALSQTSEDFSAENEGKSEETPELGGSDCRSCWDATYDVTLRFAAGPDSNVLARPEGSDRVLAFRGAFFAEGRFRRGLRVKSDGPVPRYMELTVGASGLLTRYHSYHEAEPRAFGGHLAFDADLVAGKSAGSKLKKLTVGLGLEWFRRNRGALVDADGHRIVPAVMFTFDAEGECELDSLVLYGSYEDRDERVPGYSSSDIDILRRSIGLDYTLTIGKGYDNQRCERQGPFRRLFRPDVLTLYFKGQYLSESTAEGLPDVRIDAYEHGAELPLPAGDLAIRHSIDWLFGLALVERGGSGPLLPEREDKRWLANLGYRYCLANCGTGGGGMRSSSSVWERLDLRLGVAYAHHDSSIEGFDLDRLAVTIGIEGRLGGWNAGSGGVIVGTAGVRLGPRTGDPGTTDPETVPGDGD